MDQVHLMRRLIIARLEDATSTTKLTSTFNDLLDQLQDVGLQNFDDKMKAIFLPMTLPKEAIGVHSIASRVELFLVNLL